MNKNEVEVIDGEKVFEAVLTAEEQKSNQFKKILMKHHISKMKALSLLKDILDLICKNKR